MQFIETACAKHARPVVRLGDRVRVGGRAGTIIDTRRGGSVLSVLMDEAGEPVITVRLTATAAREARA